jgi:hypothetical protein
MLQKERMSRRNDGDKTLSFDLKPVMDYHPSTSHTKLFNVGSPINPTSYNQSQIQSIPLSSDYNPEKTYFNYYNNPPGDTNFNREPQLISSGTHLMKEVGSDELPSGIMYESILIRSSKNANMPL